MKTTRPPEESPDRHLVTSVAPPPAEHELERMRAGVSATLEALEAGDIDLAVEILFALLEGGAELLPQLPCPECGLDAVWPGRLEVHRLNVHQVELEELPCAA